MSGNMCSHEESLKENEETKKEINNLQEEPKYEVGKCLFFFLNLISIIWLLLVFSYEFQLFVS